MLEFRVSPGFAAGRLWAVDRLEPREEIRIPDRLVELEPQYLKGLNEAERGRIELSLKHKDQELARKTLEIRILARDEWVGFPPAGTPRSFVMPNDPAVPQILRKASDVLQRAAIPQHSMDISRRT